MDDVTQNPQNPLTWKIFQRDWLIPANRNNNTNWLNDSNGVSDSDDINKEKPNYPTWFSWYTQKKITDGYENADAMNSDPRSLKNLSNLAPGVYPQIDGQVFNVGSGSN